MKPFKTITQDEDSFRIEATSLRTAVNIKDGVLYLYQEKDGIGGMNCQDIILNRETTQLLKKLLCGGKK